MPLRKALGSSGTLSLEDLGFLRSATPPDTCDDIKDFLALRKTVLGHDEKDRQYRLKMCDGSMAKYVEKVWEQNEKIIQEMRQQARVDRVSSSSSASECLDSPKSSGDPSQQR